MKNIRVCTRCVYDETIPAIHFDDDGVCNYCHMHDDLDRRYPNGEAGASILETMAGRIRRAGRGRKYDCVVGVSGGCDSSFTLHKAVELGLRPLAVHFDNTWDSPVSSQNIYNVTKALGVDLHTYVADNKEYDDIYMSFMRSGLRDIEAPTDIAIITTLYLACERFGIKYIIEGSSFRTEGISPLGWLYMDGKFIESVHKRFGKLPMKTYPNLTLSRFLKWSAVYGIKRWRPLWHVDYDKEAAKAMLRDRYGWLWYGGHHLDNRFTTFCHTYACSRRGNMDTRVLGYAALVRDGQLDRRDALHLLNQPQDCPEDILRMVGKRLGLSRAELDGILRPPDCTWQQFPTYKRAFERLRPLFWLLMKLDRVPESFYMKFCRPLAESGYRDDRRER